MKSVPSADPCHMTYVVTYGMAHRLQSFRSETFSVPPIDHRVFKNFQTGLVERVEEALPQTRVHAIHMDELERNIWKQAEGCLARQRNPVVLSTGAELASASLLNTKVENHTLHFNRLFNHNGEIIGYGPRHGYDSLSRQFEELGRKIGTRPIVLLEDGAFSGQTLRFILNRLKAQGLKVSNLIVGFCCARAQVLLKEAFNEETIIVDEIVDLVDWIPDHDLIPFTPNCGRVIGRQTDEGFTSVHTLDGLTHSFPYILPFGKMGEWSSLPQECLGELSKFCLDAAIEIFSEFGEYAGHKVTIGDLVKCYCRFSMPITIGNHEVILPLETEIVSFLKKVRASLEQ